MSADLSWRASLILGSAVTSRRREGKGRMFAPWILVIFSLAKRDGWHLLDRVSRSMCDSCLLKLDLGLPVLFARYPPLNRSQKTCIILSLNLRFPEIRESKY